MLIVVFIIMAVTGTIITDTHTLIAPFGSCYHVTLVVNGLTDLQIGIISIRNRETANKYFQIVIVAFQLSEPVVRINGTTFAITEIFRCEVVVFAHEQKILKVVGGVVVKVADIISDVFRVVSTSCGKVHQCGGAARLDLPVDERL